MAKYIELDKAIEQFCSCGSVFTYGDNVCKAIVSRLKQVPTADVRENVHAHWEKTYGDSRFMCSVCKGKENVPTMMGKPIVWGFCPNCGAKMDERGEE